MKITIKINELDNLEIGGFVWTLVHGSDCDYSDCDYNAFVKKWVQKEFQIHCTVFRKSTRRPNKWTYVAVCTGSFISTIKGTKFKTALKAIEACNKHINF
jgi:hypothetical protein